MDRQPNQLDRQHRRVTCGVAPCKQGATKNEEKLKSRFTHMHFLHQRTMVMRKKRYIQFVGVCRLFPVALQTFPSAACSRKCFFDRIGDIVPLTSVSLTARSGMRQDETDIHCRSCRLGQAQIWRQLWLGWGCRAEVAHHWNPLLPQNLLRPTSHKLCVLKFPVNSPGCQTQCP